jgi:hypothetical protein
MKKYRSITTITLLALVVMITGCVKKSDIIGNNAGPYYVKFNANGAQQNFTIPLSTAKFHDSLIAFGNKIHIFSTGAANQNIHSLQFGIYTDKLLTSNTTYKESELVFGYQPKLIMIYDNNPGTFGNLSIGTYDPFAPFLYPGTPRNCVLTIEEITATTIKGTFSGIVYHEKPNGDPDISTSINITGGEFFLPAKL